MSSPAGTHFHYVSFVIPQADPQTQSEVKDLLGPQAQDVEVVGKIITQKTMWMLERNSKRFSKNYR
jgi:hypothetical protein